jgi:hypothetical protein
LIKPSLYLRPTSSDSAPTRPALCDPAVYLYHRLRLKGRSLSQFLLPSTLLASVIASTSGTIFLPRISLIRGSPIWKAGTGTDHEEQELHKKDRGTCRHMSAASWKGGASNENDNTRARARQWDFERSVLWARDGKSRQGRHIPYSRSDCNSPRSPRPRMSRQIMITQL